MKWIIKQSVAATVLFFALSAYANDPTSVPWPVGTDQNATKTLLNSYGEPNTWSEGRFHAGIDIDSQTESGGDGDEVRCVIDGVVTEIRDFYIGGITQWVVVTAEGTGIGDHEDYGWWYEHLNNPYVSPYSLWVGKPVVVGTNLGCMHPDVTTPHIHFKWSWWEWPVTDELWDWCYVNPLDYLNPEPEQGANFDWIFNPNNNDPAFRSFFLEDMVPSSWPSSAGSVPGIMLDEYNLLEDVDLFFGFSLRGQGQSTTTGCGRDDLVPERIGWNLIRETTSGDELLEENYIVNLDCPLSNEDGNEKVWQLYFRHEMGPVFPGDGDGLIVCLTNCGDMQGWEGIGIENIEENCWDTNINYEFSDDVINPVLAAYPDGSYQIDVTCFTHVNDVLPNPEVQFMRSIDCELHNFYPALREVSMLDLETDQTYYHAEWVPDGLSADLDVSVDNPASAGAELQVVLVFTEEMNTSSLSAVLGPLSVGNGEWSGSVVPNDTWIGEVTLPTEESDGSYVLSVGASDTDENDLMDPEGAGTVPGPSYDTHHKLSLNFGAELEWAVLLNHQVGGSPVLGDLDGDGDLDIAVQTREGVVELIDENGNILQTLESGDWSGFFSPIYSSPAIADLNLDGNMEVLAVHPYGCNAWDAATGTCFMNWPVDMGSEAGITGTYPSHSAPAVCDLIGDEHPEVVICRHLDENQPYAICTVWMYGYQGGNRIWQHELEPGGVSVTCTPAVGDISIQLSGKEILVCTSDGFNTNYPYPPSDRGKDWDSAIYLLDPADGNEIWKSAIYNCYFFASPVAGDVDGDGENEIIIGTHIDQSAHRVLVLDAYDGCLEHTFYTSSTVVNSAAIADMNDDDILDIVAVDNTGHVYCWSGEAFEYGDQYDPLPGFPVVVTGAPTSPSIADIDRDYKVEIVVGTGDGYLYAINGDGSICSGYPVTDPGLNTIKGQPVIADLDNDSSLEIVFADGSDSYAYCYDLGVNSFPAEIPWRQFQHDSWHTGCFDADNTIPEPPTNLTGDITYNGISCEVELEWDLSVNDPYSGSPEEPADVVSYQIYRGFPTKDPVVVGRVHAGTGTYTDIFNPGVYSVVRYRVTSSDGTNESEFSNDVRFHTRGYDVLSSGCSVIEEFSDRLEPRRTDE
ncbi:MAG: hypothetical protein K8R76_08465, partial [Candidatus Aegiribacteria sp.]|nr:hypothetical protein [Candidatus Aegiribacteria sp.]